MSGKKATRAQLVEAAMDLNKVVDPADDDGNPTPIDVSLSVEEIRRQIRDVSTLLTETDVIQEGTRLVVAELNGAEPPAQAAAEAKQPAVETPPAETPPVEAEKAAEPGASGQDAEASAEPAKRGRRGKDNGAAAAPQSGRGRSKRAAAATSTRKVPEKNTTSRGQSARALGKSAKPKDEFRALREDTIRGRIFSRMDGTRTVDQIADELSLSASNAHAHVYCLWRDCGIGFSFDDDRRVCASLPTGVTSAFRAAAATT